MTELEAAMQPVITLEEAIDNFAATANRIADELIEARALNTRLVDALKMIYDKWENGVACYEAVDGAIDESSSPIGSAVKLSFAEEQTILNLIIDKAMEWEDSCANCRKPYRAHLLHDGNKCAPGKDEVWFSGKLASAITAARELLP